MTVVSSKEFASHQDKYFDLALNEHVYVKRESDNIMFIVARDKKEYSVPDDDLCSAITIDDVFDKVKENIRIKYANR